MDNPKCVKCGLNKPLNLFIKNKGHSPKIMSCGETCRIYLAKYYIDTKIKQLEKHSKWIPNFY